jgi:hypothetical protein
MDFEFLNAIEAHVPMKVHGHISCLVKWEHTMSGRVDEKEEWWDGKMKNWKDEKEWEKGERTDGWAQSTLLGGRKFNYLGESSVDFDFSASIPWSRINMIFFLNITKN